MLTHYRSTDARHYGSGDFRLSINYPGRAMGEPLDPSGILQLGRFDRATLRPGTVVRMHEHQNDEILSYLVAGEMVHEDSTGLRESVSPARLMLMNSGASIFHQESVPEGGEGVEMLQIFFRPAELDLEPLVQFAPFSAQPPTDAWRLIAGPEGSGAPLVLRTGAEFLDAWVADSVGAETDGTREFFYVFSGKVSVQGHEGDFEAGDGFLLDDEAILILAEVPSLVVRFRLKPGVSYSRMGMYSGG